MRFTSILICLYTETMAQFTSHILDTFTNNPVGFLPAFIHDWF